ncbi:hypothetical protein SteCoe_30876 [Stentor coeruleus]|uniref:Uncharacterized protein n=1 Tax=Stentor coeruleus TaxID=5963 RepID=A0A1R2B332_9CILI|nr:hypothetical protein SteCoe_30876 [Stentor coeruleus]
MLTLDRERLLNVLKDYEKLKVEMIIVSMIKRKQLKKTSIMSQTETPSEDVNISLEEHSFPIDQNSLGGNASFIEDCSSTLEPKVAWD